MNHHRHLIITHADDPVGRDPVLLVARCYREIIESRSKLPQDIVTTTEVTGDDLTVYDETSSTDRVPKRRRIESMTSFSSLPIHNRSYQKFIDTTSSDPTEILTRKTVKQGDITYTTIDITLAYKVDDSKLRSVALLNDHEAWKEANASYLSKLRELFKNLFDEIIDYLDDYEAEMFLINVINTITNKMGRGTLYVTAALKALDRLFFDIGDTVKREEFKVEIDMYMKYLEDERIKYSAKLRT